MKDLVISVADSYQEKVLEALLPRIPFASGTSIFTYDIIRNPGHDPGSYNDSHELLRSFSNQYRYALVVFDFEGSGVEHLKTREQIEGEVQGLLSTSGWGDRCCVIVINPELENWMWINNINVERAIGWEKQMSLYDWARENGYLEEGAIKPSRPKETLEEALRISETSKSASIYKNIATRVSYRDCVDPAFQKMINQFLKWFPV